MGRWMTRAVVIAIAGFCVTGCSDSSKNAASVGPDGDVAVTPSDWKPPGNVLLIISDDLGIDAAACYDIGTYLAPQKNIESLCKQGIVFERAWTNPVCSPTRATMLTGRYGFRTGIGAPSPPGIKLTETTIPKMLDKSPHLGFNHANIGKWHLSTNDNGGKNNPVMMGYNHYEGCITGVLKGYYFWDKTVASKGVDAETTQVDRYATSDVVDDAIDWLGKQKGPWFMWVAFNAPHSPFEAPPENLHSYGDLSKITDPYVRDVQTYRAMIEAMDREIGRLLGSMSPEVRANTHIIYVGDNGSPGSVAQPPVSPSRAKSTVYRGGIQVPMVIAGPSVRNGGRRVGALVNSADLFATILELAGVDVAATLPKGVQIDSQSLVPYLSNPDQKPIREWIYADHFGPKLNAQKAAQTMRNERYKIIHFGDGKKALFDMHDDPWEKKNLLDSGVGSLSAEAKANYDLLEKTIKELLATKK